MRMGERHLGGPWTDITAKQIQLLKDGIQQYEMSVADLEAGLTNA
jgi:hypothetical protein